MCQTLMQECMPPVMGNRSKHKQEIHSNQLQILFAGTRQSILVSLAAAAILLFIQFDNVPLYILLGWSTLFILIMAGRFYLSRKYQQAAPSPAESWPWQKKFILGSTLTGVVWGGAGILFYPLESILHQVCTILILTGLATGAMSVLAVNSIAYSNYASSTLLPVIGYSILQGDKIHILFGILISLMLWYLLNAGKRLNESLNYSFQLRYENKDLLEELKREKAKLGSRLSRILSDFSTEIYIINLETLGIIQTNSGAALNLGYDMDEMLHLKFSDINPECCLEKMQRILAPLEKDQQGQVVFRGVNYRKNGSSYPVEARFQISSKESPPVCVATVIDDTDRFLYEEKLLHQANHNPLTGLPNKTMAMACINHAIERCKRKGNKLVVLFLDLDNFKNINDSMGHAAGDELLKEVAHRLCSVTRKVDITAHLSGDEFLILIENVAEIRQCNGLVDKIFKSLSSQPYFLLQREFFITCSIGISIYPDHGDSCEKLLQHADTAMYKAKSKGKNNYQYFDQVMNDVLTRQLHIEAQLRKAIDRQEFELYFQPQCTIEGKVTVAAEALLRWTNKELGPVSPVEFIPVAEDCGLIVEIGTWVLRRACQEAASWTKKMGRSLRVAVNVSSRQFRSDNLLDTVTQALKDSGLAPELLELEITESLLMQDAPDVLSRLNALRKMGIHLSLDDFGTGYSSLSYLKRFPIQSLKIDRSFIRDLENDPSDQALVNAIIAMAHSLNLEVVAEGVENENQRTYLKERQVTLIQGYLFSRPLPVQVFCDYVLASLPADN